MARSPNLTALLYFETVARRGTILRAAEEVSVSSSAISQQIKLLEQDLGVRLFRREGRVLRLTLEGEQLYQKATLALGILRDADRQFRRVQDSHALNMRVTPSFGVRWLGPRLSEFIAAHPGWQLRLDAAPDPTDFNREVMELEIRYGVADWSGYHVEPVLCDHVLPLCSPEYLQGLTPTDDPQGALSRARLIGTPRALCQWDIWARHQGITLRDYDMPILMDRSSMALQLALDGVGVVLDSMALAMPEIAARRLVPVVPQLPVLAFPAYYAICPTRYASRRPVRAFLSWLKEQVTAHEAELSALCDGHGLRVTVLDGITGATHP